MSLSPSSVWLRRLVAVVALAFMALSTVGAAPWRRPPERPRLVVWVVVDQGRADAPARLGDALQKDGFNRFMSDGAWFTDARFGHMSTWTASGHATLVTGAYADRHGLMSNYWFEDGVFTRAADGESFLQSDADPTLRISTLGDELHLANRASRVVSVSLKDRAAIIMGGESSDGTYWLDTAVGRFVGKGRAGGDVAPWVTAFNDSGAVDAPFGSRWETTLPEALLNRYGSDACPSESDGYGLGRTFPRTLDGGAASPSKPYYKALLRTPQGTGVLLDFARAAVDGAQLGQDDAPDILFVSVSSTDYAGHFFGTQSWEYQELMADLDRRLGPFIDDLEARVGRGRVGVVLSADHGGPPMAECAPEGLSAGRLGYNQVSQAVEDALIARFGLHGEESEVTSDGGWVVGFEAPGLFLDIPDGIDAAAVRAEARRALLALDGMLDVCDTHNPQGPWAQACRRSTAPGRAPDLMLIAKPYWVFSQEKYQGRGTTHGSPHAYDARVLMGLWGPGIAQQVRHGTADVAQAAATVAAWLGIPPPAAAELGAWEGLVDVRVGR